VGLGLKNGSSKTGLNKSGNSKTTKKKKGKGDCLGFTGEKRFLSKPRSQEEGEWGKPPDVIAEAAGMTFTRKNRVRKRRKRSRFRVLFGTPSQLEEGGGTQGVGGALNGVQASAWKQSTLGPTPGTQRRRVGGDTLSPKEEKLSLWEWEGKLAGKTKAGGGSKNLVVWGWAFHGGDLEGGTSAQKEGSASGQENQREYDSERAGT